MERSGASVEPGIPEALSIDTVDVRFSSDSVRGPDVLDVLPEADALARLVTSESCRPPLTLGIFGDWGAGKTFFMRTMMQQVEERRPAGVVQIEFNAWHYTDTNIMAGLVHRVFETIGATAGQQGMQLLRELQRGSELVNQAQRSLDASTAERDETRLHAESIKSRLQKLQSVVTVKAFSSPPVQDALAAHGVKQVVTHLTRGVERPPVESLEQIVNSTDRLLTFRLGWLANRWGVLLGATVGVVGSLAVVTGFVPLATEISTLNMAVTLAGGALCVAMLTSSWLGLRARRRLERFVEKYRSHAADFEREGAEQHELAAELRRAEAQLQDAQARVDAAHKQIAPTSASLADYIDQRLRTSTNDAALGLVTKIRSDFERLSRMLLGAPDVPLTRIIVYIDDLDRCPPEKVVEVLTATHLLLGFPLFVVVLAADARWISRSLQKHFPDLLRVMAGAEGAAGTLGANASSIDYLEKIVHLPLWLKPLDETRCRRLIDSLLAPGELTEEERAFMSRLAPLLGRSPRTVTRFLNVYRLLRTGPVTSVFPHKPAILLLGLVTGEPELAAFVLERLREADSALTIKQFTNALATSTAGNARMEWLTQLWKQSGGALRTLLNEIGPEVSIADLQRIGIEAQRYSFLKP